MRLLFATDLHGHQGHWLRLIDLAESHAPDVVILGGDMLPDAHPAEATDCQVRFVRQSLPEYLHGMRRRCDKVQIVTILGNHDWLCSRQALDDLERQGLLRILQTDGQCRIGGFRFVGYSYAPPCPYPVKDFEKLDFADQPYLFDGGLIWDEESGEPRRIDPAIYLKTTSSIRDDLSQIAPVDGDWILVAHAPPGDTDLDMLPNVGHVGSRSVRDFILQRQPVLSFHGHIHESPGLTGRFWQRLGNTVAVNPGQREDELTAVLADLSAETITLTPVNVEGADPQPVVLPREPAGRSL